MLQKVSKVLLFIIILSLPSKKCFPQDNNTKGYWDIENTLIKTISINPLTEGKKFTSINLPIGTTQILYKITVSQNGKEFGQSLSSILSKIPMTDVKLAGSIVGISSGISGSDKCYYSIFSSKDEANNFIKYGIKNSQPCYKNDVEIVEHINILRTNDICLENNKTIFFGFKNTNSISSEDIRIEVIPWIDKKLATGWDAHAKQEFLIKCKNGANDLPNKEEFCLCFLDKFIENYTLDEYNSLLPDERVKFAENNEKECTETTGVNEKLKQQSQDKADKYFEDGDYKNAISEYLEIINSNNADADDYKFLAESYLLTKQFTKALKYIKIAEQMDEDDLSIKLDLAHSLLLTDNFDIAKKIYLKYKNENIDETTSWKKQIQEDFKSFTDNEIKSDYFNIILQVIDK